MLERGHDEAPVPLPWDAEFRWKRPPSDRSDEASLLGMRVSDKILAPLGTPKTRNIHVISASAHSNTGEIL